MQRMSRLARWARIGWLGLAVFAFQVRDAAADTVPAEVFFGQPTLGSAVLSPNERWLATTVKSPEGRMRLVVTDLENKEPSRVVAAFSKLDVFWVEWVNDDWLVFNTLDQIEHRSDMLGSGLMAVKRDGERLRLIIKREWDTDFGATAGRPLEANHVMLRLGAQGTNEIVVGEWRSDPRSDVGTWAPHVVDVSSGERRQMLAQVPKHAQHWYFDAKARARGVITDEDGQIRILWRESADAGEWREIGRFEQLAWDYAPAFLDEKDQFFVKHTGRDGFARVSRFDPATSKIVDEPFVSTPGFTDSIRIMQDRPTGRVTGLEVDTDGTQRIWLEPAMKDIQARIDATLPGRINLASCSMCSDPRVVLVHSYSDRHPGEYLLFRPKDNRWERLGPRRPAVDPQRMASLEFHRTKARDGKDLPVWITRPTGSAGKALPAVVLLHGGPWLRGTYWRWDGEAQFLASRGYVVIEPEFRGSRGYGWDHYRSGWKQWGQSMQDDVVDAFKFAVDKGGVDPSRVCLMGGSYGGYSTLMGLAREPQSWRCGIAIAAVTDPRLLYTMFWSDASDHTKKHLLYKRLGDPVKDADMLKANAPIELSASIRAPLMLVHGGRDRRVPIDHGERMREALRKSGNPPEWVTYDNEGHSFSKPENQLDKWRRIEAFLAKHLK